jgi:hypothetical protein
MVWVLTLELLDAFTSKFISRITDRCGWTFGSSELAPDAVGVPALAGRTQRFAPTKFFCSSRQTVFSTHSKNEIWAQQASRVACIFPKTIARGEIL